MEVCLNSALCSDWPKWNQNLSEQISYHQPAQGVKASLFLQGALYLLSGGLSDLGKEHIYFLCSVYWEHLRVYLYFGVFLAYAQTCPGIWPPKFLWEVWETVVWVLWIILLFPPKRECCWLLLEWEKGICKYLRVSNTELKSSSLPGWRNSEKDDFKGLFKEKCSTNNLYIPAKIFLPLINILIASPGLCQIRQKRVQILWSNLV